MTLPDPEALYVALIGDTRRLRDLRRLTYWCHADRCLLLDAIGVGDTVLLHQKRFKNSSEVNQRRSSEAGRRANTFDGERHWKPRSYWIGQSALAWPDDRPEPRLSIQCDHVGVLPGGDDLTLTAGAFREDWGTGHTEVTVRPDGSRFAIE